MSLYCVKQMSALHEGGRLKDLFIEVMFMKFSGLEMGGGGLKPYAYYEYVTPNNKNDFKRKSFSALFYSPQVISV